MNDLVTAHAEIAEKTPHGVNHIGVPYFERADYGGGTWFRMDRWVSDRDGHEAHERRFALDASDRSPMARTMYAGSGNCNYHPKCACCWLGFSHTLAYHQRCAVGPWD